jgi:signal transduction histidine kinase
MEPSLIEQVFEPFFTTRESSGGTGLGLATTAEFVRESHGGIRVESAPGEGAAFHLYFPLAAPAARRRADPAPRPDPRLASV